MPPLRGEFRIGGNAELDELAGAHAEESRLVEESLTHQLVEAIGTDRRPVAVHFDDEVAAARFELHAKHTRRAILSRTAERQDRGEQAKGESQSAQSTPR